MRTKPYKDVTRARCIRCGERAKAVWETCALGKKQVAVCDGCDAELNRVALAFLIGQDKADAFVARYKRREWSS